jgi:hypothetical protein
VEAPLDPARGRPREELRIASAEGAQAQLRLNTAELNSLTLALFAGTAGGLDRKPTEAEATCGWSTRQI